MAEIVLLTDFGLEDNFLGVMKGVIKRISPASRIIDLNHNIEPFNIKQASYELLYSYRYFPSGSIFVSVVDPGVGSDRKILCAKSKDYIFLAPDNGILYETLLSLEEFELHEVENREFMSRQISGTFHGRDIFAPIGAAIANGTAPSSLGRKLEIKEMLKLKFVIHYNPKYKHYYPQIFKKDRFGNLVTNLNIEEVKPEASIEIRIDDITIKHLSKTFSSVKIGEIAAYKNSDGHLEIGVNQGRATDFIQTNALLSVTLS